MESGNDHFTPERVDEQIADLHPDSVPDALSDEAQLVNALHRYYSAPALAEDHAALERARQRVLGNHSTADTLEVGNRRVTSPSPVAPPRSTRLIRIVSSLAAVILVGTLVGGWFAVTHLIGKSPTVSASTPSGLYVVEVGVAYRLDPSSGRVIWQHSLLASDQAGQTTVQVVNGMEFVVDSFDIYALDASSGKLIWHDHIIQGFFWFGVASGRVYLSYQYTYTALSAADGSLLWHSAKFYSLESFVVDGNLYLRDNSTLSRLDGATGQIRWSDYIGSVPLQNFLNAPLVVNGVVYAAAGNHLYAINDQTGEILWRQTGTVAPVEQSLAPAFVARGILYVYEELINIDQLGSQQTFDASTVFAYSAKTGQLLWTAEPGYTDLINLPITGSLLFVAVDDNGAISLVRLDAQTGRVTWQARLGAGSKYQTQWAGMFNGTLYLLEVSTTHGNITYTVKSFNPRTGQMLSSVPVTPGGGYQGLFVEVAASHGLLYFQTFQQIGYGGIFPSYAFAAYRLSNGSLAWSHSTPMPHSPPPNDPEVYSQVVLAP